MPVQKQLAVEYQASRLEAPPVMHLPDEFPPSQYKELSFKATALVASGGLAVAAFMAQKYGYTKELITPIKQISESLCHVFPGVIGAIAGYKSARKLFPDDRKKAITGAMIGGFLANGAAEASQEIIASSGEKSLSNLGMIPENTKDWVFAQTTSILTARKLAKFEKAIAAEKAYFIRNGTYPG